MIKSAQPSIFVIFNKKLKLIFNATFFKILLICNIYSIHIYKSHTYICTHIIYTYIVYILCIYTHTCDLCMYISVYIYIYTRIHICVICVYICVCAFFFPNRKERFKELFFQDADYPERNILENWFYSESLGFKNIKYRIHKSWLGNVSFLQARTSGSWHRLGAK